MPIFELGSIEPYIGVLTGITVTLIITFLLRRLLEKTLPNYMGPTIYKPIIRVIVYTVLFFGLISSLAPLNIDLTGLLVAGGAIGVAISFASRTVFSNLLSGVFIYIDKPFKLGDSISVEGVAEGVVKEIDIFSTKVVSWDGQTVRIPNEKLFSSLIINYSASPVRRISILVGISYSSDLDKAKQALLDLAESHPMVLVEPSPDVIVQYGDSSILLNLICWVPTSQWWSTRVWLLSKMKKALEEAGVEMPFPLGIAWLKKAEKQN